MRRARAVHAFDFVLRNVQLLLRSVVVGERMIERDQIHMQLNAVQRAFRRRRRQMRDRRLIFLHRILIAILQLGDLAANGMQTVGVRIDALGAREKNVRRRWMDPAATSRLGGRELQAQVARLGIGGLRVEPRGIFQLCRPADRCRPVPQSRPASD